MFKSQTCSPSVPHGVGTVLWHLTANGGKKTLTDFIDTICCKDLLPYVLVISKKKAQEKRLYFWEALGIVGITLAGVEE